MSFTALLFLSSVEMERERERGHNHAFDMWVIERRRDGWVEK
jgi:hypothetical protein